jgi:hypothetical protein
LLLWWLMVYEGEWGIGGREFEREVQSSSECRWNPMQRGV